MGKIVKTTDFVGVFAITQNNFTTPKLQAFIDRFEKEYLYDLLGVTLANLFLADISTPYTPPANADYLIIYNPLDIDAYCKRERSEGIKQMLIAFIYWEFVKDQPVKNTITGPVIAQNEVSTGVDFNDTNLYLIYNLGVKTFNVIQRYIRDNYNDYSDYKGTCKAINHWSI